MIFWGLIALSLSIFALDIFFKQVIVNDFELGEERGLKGGKVVLRKVYNRGALLNLLQKRPGFVKKMSVGMLGAVLGYDAWILTRRRRPLGKLGMMMLTGGALSNVFDRVLRGKVVDYIGFPLKNKFLGSITYNIGDFAIFIGGVLVTISETAHKIVRKMRRFFRRLRRK